MKIAFATTVLPHRETSGGEIASQAFVDALRLAGHDVDVFGYARTEEDLADLPRGSTAVDVRPIETKDAGGRSLVWMASALATGQPYVCRKFRSPRFVAALERRFARGDVDLFVVDHSQMGWLLDELSRHPSRKVFVAHNAETRLYADQARLTNEYGQVKRRLFARDAALIGALEARLTRECDQTWVLTESELDHFSHLASRSTVRLMLLPGRSVHQPTEPIEKRCDIALLGTWNWTINGAGLDWFLREVLPLLPPELTIRIGGRGSHPLPVSRPGLTGVGFVDDPVRFLLEARALAVPTVTGAGVQLKTIESIATGIPTVSTALGVRGLDRLPDHVVRADGAFEFAGALTQAIRRSPCPNEALDWVNERKSRFATSIAEALAALDGPGPIIGRKA